MHIVQTNGNTASTSPGRSLHRLPNRRAKVFPAPNCLRSAPHNVACHSDTVLRAPLLSDFHIQRYCQWYGCSTAYFDKGRRGFGNSSKCREKFGASRQTLFQFGAQRRAGHRDGLRHRNSVTETIENTLTRDFSLCWRLSLC